MESPTINHLNRFKRRPSPSIAQAFKCQFWLAVFPIILMSCATLPRNPVPVELMDNAIVLETNQIRTWSGQFNPLFQDDIIQSVYDQNRNAVTQTDAGPSTFNALTISGGAENGAFGAGFLNGWTATGKRPEFKLVTGISTGALIAPFAFLGSQYDEILHQMYTSIRTKDVVKIKSLFEFGGESLGDSSPLWNQIKKYVDADVLKAVAEAHINGRRLYISTTNLDADRGVVWNMGAIAASGNPKALDMFCKVMLASASIPGAFPPVYFDVDVNGKSFDEMHVDGGLKAQVFFYGAVLNIADARRKLQIDVPTTNGDNLFIIRNGFISPQPEEVRRRVKDILTRTLASMTKTAGRNDLYRIYVFAKRDKLNFHYVDIPSSHKPGGEEPFDPGEMTRLFELGYEIALSESPWHKAPPGLSP